MIRAIETRYKGCRFRSRLEARWAVFFDALGIEWQYEPQGFTILRQGWEPDPDEEEGNVWRWLPDFFLPQFGCWVEVKGDTRLLDGEMLHNAVELGGQLPGIEDSGGTTRGILLLGNIPVVGGGQLVIHPILQHHEGVCANSACFGRNALNVLNSDYSGIDWDGGSRLFFYGQLEEKTWVGCEMWKHLTERDIITANSCQQYAYTRARSARFEYGENG